ncbi:MAG: hypothetical protein NTX03_07590 [Bacteroidetes bacterium]|nr:hypothetical protein [Bacteroidota bacterium]
MPNKVLRILLYLIAVAFSIKSVKEPDIFWQTKIGHYILQNLSIPKQDVFSILAHGQPWTNIKWGFEVLMALVDSAFGIIWMPLLQILFSVLIVFFVLKIVSLLSNGKLLHPLSYLLLMFGIMGMAYRFNTRPEMVSHLFTIALIYAWLFAKRNSIKFLLWVVPIQILWCNMHDAYALGYIISGVFLLSCFVEDFKNKENLKYLGIVVLQFLISIINPKFLGVFTQPFNTFSQVTENKYTLEMQGISSPAYWQKEVYIAAFMLLILVAGIAFLFLKRKEKPNLALVILSLLTLYLATSAFRNIVFFIIVSLPMAVILFDKIIEEKETFLRKPMMYVSIGISAAFGLLLYAAIVTDSYYKFFNERQQFGFYSGAANNPSSTADYLNRSNAAQPIYSDYLSSSYLLYAVKNFKTYVDLRDMDVFTKKQIMHGLYVSGSPDSFNAADKKYNFQTVVLLRKQFIKLHYWLMNNPEFTLTHIDECCAVYQKKSAGNVVDMDFKEANIMSSAASLFNHILNPFFDSNKKNFETPGDYLFEHYLNAGMRPEAINIIKTEKRIPDARKKILTAELLFDSINIKQDKSYLDRAKIYLEKSKEINPKDIQVYLDLGNIAKVEGEYIQAEKYFKTAENIDAKDIILLHYFADLYMKWATANEVAANPDYTKKAISYYKRIIADDPLDYKTYFSMGNAYDMINEFGKAAKCMKASLALGLKGKDTNIAKEVIEKNEE